MSDLQQLHEKIEIEVNEDEIIAEINKDYPQIFDMLDFNEYNLKEKLEKNAYWYQDFRNLMLKEKHKLHRIEILRDEYIGKLYHKLRFENDIKLGKVEVEKYYIPKDAKAIKFQKLWMRQSIRVEVFQSFMDSFKQQGFNMNVFQKEIS